MEKIAALLHKKGRFTVVGLGASGQSVAQLLHAGGARVAVSDCRAFAELDAAFRSWLIEKDIDLECGGHTAEFLLRSDCLVVSPGVPLQTEALQQAAQADIPLIGEMGLSLLFVDRPVIAVTGTNGKSTVVRLLGDILQQHFARVFVGGNIGTPLAEYVDAGRKADALVLEVSSFQLDSMGFFRPEVAVLLNITPDHLDRYDDYEAYIASKFSLFKDQTKEQAAVVNVDDPLIADKIDALGSRVLRFGRLAHNLPGAWLEGEEVVFLPAEDAARERYPLPEALAIGPNPSNVMAAVCAARSLGCSRKEILTAIENFRCLAHRMTVVAEEKGVLFVDDSKATNVGALQAALDSMTRPVVLIAGGRDKGGDYRLLLEAVRHHVRAMVLIGEAREAMEQAFRGLIPIEMAADMDEAVERAAQLAASGDVVLLSPACASFDMFNSYAHRGDVFQQAVRDLLAARAVHPSAMSA